MIIYHLLSNTPFIDLPKQVLGWLGFIFLMGLIYWGLRSWYEPFPLKDRKTWVTLSLLIIAAPLASLFLGIELPGGGAVPLPNLPYDSPAPILMLFFALPWVMAAGLLGVIPAAIVGLISGTVLAFWHTHSLYTLPEVVILALVYAHLVRQSFRTPLYRFLRHPAGAALAVSGLFIVVRIFSVFFVTNGPVAVRLDYAITASWSDILARFLELIIAGGIAEILYLMKVKAWYRPSPLVPSPSEISMQRRYFYTLLTFMAILSIVMMLGNYATAGGAAQNMVRDRLATSSEVAVQTLPYFIETGTSLLQYMADPNLLTMGTDQLSLKLEEQVHSAPFFRQVHIFDANGNPVTGYPVVLYDQIRTGEEDETNAIARALQGIPAQVIVLSPWANESTAQISFVVSIKDSNGQAVGVMIGRTDLASNSFTQQVIQTIESAIQGNGSGLLLDEQGRILFQTAQSSGLILTRYQGKLEPENELFDDVSTTGTRSLAYYRKDANTGWAVLLSVPAQQAQQLALNIAIPMLTILAIGVIIGLVAINFSIRKVTSSLQRLAEQTTQMSRGKLDVPVNLAGEDEVGRLGYAFEKMRVSLRDRLEELNSLLRVSQGVAANLDVKNAVLPVLEAASDNHTACARVVLARDVALDAPGDGWIAFGHGKDADKFEFLDEQLFRLMRNQDIMPIPNTNRIRRLQFPTGKAQPGALIALPVHHENSYYGVLWVGYNTTHVFSEEEVRFLTTLASEVAIAAANSRLYATAEIGRQRLDAVLASTPDPVLVFDNQNCLFLLNPAALQVPGLILSSIVGKPVAEVLGRPDLVDLFNTVAESNMATREIEMNLGRIYYASVAPVIIRDADDGVQNFGKICLLRDITHFKELDTLKSDFVATVSHDLRSPLTLMRGYATMLQMLGELNDQQKGYVQKMILGVDNMARLVNNLLDLGRIEAGVDLKLERIKLAEIIEAVVTSLNLQATQKEISIQVDIIQKNMVVEADPALLQQAVYNLVENAIKYTPSHGIIKIRMNERNHRAIIDVQDNGIGVAPLDLPRVFEKFYRSGRREAFSQRGTGLGLAIVKSVAERHGGRVWVESQLGKGSTFFLELPVTPAFKGK